MPIQLINNFLIVFREEKTAFCDVWNFFEKEFVESKTILKILEIN